MNFLLHHTNLFFRIFFILNSSSSLTICDEDCRFVICWKEREFIATDWSMTEWNTLWILNSVFRQKKCELIFLTMMYLTFFASNFFQLLSHFIHSQLQLLLKATFFLSSSFLLLSSSQFLSWVCNKTDAQLIIFKYKKNTMKRKEELHIKVKR